MNLGPGQGFRKVVKKVHNPQTICQANRLRIMYLQ